MTSETLAEVINQVRCRHWPGAAACANCIASAALAYLPDIKEREEDRATIRALAAWIKLKCTDAENHVWQPLILSKHATVIARATKGRDD